MNKPITALLVGAGHMGASHGRALAEIDEFDLVGIVTRGESGVRLASELGGVDHFGDFYEALAATEPDAVAIASFTETHVPFATAAIEAGCDVFLEKPLAEDLASAEALVDLALERNRTLVAGYILRHHPSWVRFVAESRKLGTPLVMRLNLNQQSRGNEWETHKAIMASTSPLVDCGVHYVDVMSQMVGVPATKVHAMGARLSDEVPSGTYNYGQLQVTFADGSVGWYESGWGPMMSETAFFVKDIVGPKGAVSIEASSGGQLDSADVNAHTVTSQIRVHHAELDANGELAREDDIIKTADEPGHDALCKREQQWFLEAIRGEHSVRDHLTTVLESMRIVFAADESIRSGSVVNLS